MWGICWLNRGSHQSASGSGCRLHGDTIRPVCVEPDVGPLHHYQRRGGADNNKTTVGHPLCIIYRGQDGLGQDSQCQDGLTP